MYKYLNLTSISPSTFLAIADFFSDWEGTSLLYSGGHLDSAQRSLLGLFPFETITVYGQQLHCQRGVNVESKRIHNPWDGLQEYFFQSLLRDAESMAFGWFGYGMGAFADSTQSLPYRFSTLPDAFWQRCAVVLDLNHSTGQMGIQVNLSALEQVNEKARDWILSFITFEGWQKFLKILPQTIIQYFTVQEAQAISECRAIYLNKVHQAKELIRAGEIYQVNLSQLFEFQNERTPFSLFRQMCSLNPAPFSAYFRHSQSTIVSTSPERFLCKRGDKLETRPIKGTIQRGKTEEEDQIFQAILLASPKERAELLMITDLMRNDLGKISAVGSVKVLELWRCEAYANVFHLLSIIQSTAQPNLTPLDIIRSCFPGGSVTGCPKSRAMEVIDDLEKRARGIYTGSMGYISGGGDFDLNIAIRTMTKEKESFFLQLGSGIVIDSDPDQEYEETLFKGESLFHIFQTREMVCQ